MVKYSVVIPTYNRAKYLEKAVNSVLNQSFRDFELIVIDDGSTDSTPEIIKSWPSGLITYIRQPNRGVSAARNRGIKAAGGDYIAFLDSDDWWLKDKLKETDRAIRDNPGYYIYHTRERWFRSGKIHNPKKIHKKPSGEIFAGCLKLCCVSMSTAVIRKELFNKIGYFDEELPACEDYDFWLRAAINFEVFLIDKILTEKEGGHKDRQSKKFYGMDRFRIKSIAGVMDSGRLSSEKYPLAFEELKKKCSIYVSGCLKRGKREEAQKYKEIIKKYEKF
ncbi:MAG: glycosyltransferase [Elusimicrobiota bacterium]|nr:glycosyltransferase [Elusimicrobiota bacterium]